MSRNFSAVPTQNYIGQVFRQVAKIEGKTVNCVVLTFNWLSYGASSAAPNQGASVNLLVGHAPLLLSITSIYIDNTNSQVPIYIYFSDTNNVITAQANTAGWYLALTNQSNFFVYGEGFVTGQIPTTTIIITDTLVLPNVDPELSQGVILGKASAQIQRGIPIFNSNYAAFALGDQFTQAKVEIEINGQIASVFPISTGFYIITSLVITCDAQQPVNGGADGTASVVFQSTGPSGLFMRQNLFLPHALAGNFVAPYVNAMIFASGNVQWKITATEQWELVVDATNIGSITGQMFWNFTFTQNPT